LTLLTCFSQTLRRREIRRPVVAGDHRLAVDQKRLRLDAECGVNDGREAISSVVAVACEAANARAIPAHHQPVAIVLDLVDPERPGGGSAIFDGRHGSMKPRRTIMGGKS
jgi:hypothetical protein